ncbi:NMD3 family protein [uncultured archaeon]|nr:NMD3 family protein [uncultured archaeon]
MVKKVISSSKTAKTHKRLTRFCPSCGTETDELFEGLCRKCFLSNVELLQAAKRVQFGLCYDCGRIRFNKFWQSYDSKNALVRDVVLRHARPLRGAKLSINYSDFTIKGKTEVPVEVTATIESNSRTLSKSKDMLLVITPEICPDCSRLRGGYYEAIIQLRGEGQERLQAAVENEMKKYTKIEPNAFISKVERLKEGVDIYVGSRTAAIKISSELRKLYNVECTITHKIHGMRQGKEVRRTTVLLRGSFAHS